MPLPSSKLLILFFISLILLASYPGWNGQFWFDDNSNILNNTSLLIQEFNFQSFWTASLSGPASKTGRPISMLSFALNNYWHGFEPYYYKLTNTIIHILNALLFFRLGYILIKTIPLGTKSHISTHHILWLSFIISLIWAISPINISSSLYIVQRMTELATFFSILGCLLYLHVRTEHEYHIRYQISFFIIFFLLLLMATLSKENGVLLIPLALLIELLLQIKQTNTSSNSKLRNPVFFRLIVYSLFLIPVIIVFLYLILQPDWLINSYSERSFTLAERLLSQFRILVYYLQQILLPDIYQMSLLHDDYAKSTSLFNPISTLYSLIFWACLIIFTAYNRKKAPWLLFGVFWFLIAHSLESTIIPLELIFEHRNYTPSYGIIFSVVLGLYVLMQRFKSPVLLITLLFAYTVYLLFNSYIISSIWGNNVFMFKVFVDNHPQSARSQLKWGLVSQQLWQKHPDNIHNLKQAINSYHNASQYNLNMVGGLNRIILLKHSLNKDFSNDLKELYHRLKTLTPHPTLTLSTRYFLEASLQTKPPLKQLIIDDYYSNLLSNPKLHGKYKAILLRDYADYLYKKNGMTLNVLEVLLKASNSFPENIELKIYLGRALINARQYSAAKKIITTTYQLDKLHKHETTLDALLKISNDKLTSKNKHDNL